MANEPSEALRRVVEAMRANQSIAAPDLSIEERRAAMESMPTAPTPDDVVIEPTNAGGVPARWISAPNARDDAVIVYYHGGGYVMGSLDTHEELMSRISRTCRARVLGVDYRLAPEDPFPAAVEDGLAAYRWALEQGFSADRVMLGGDSAGGGLTLATLLSARDAGAPMPAGAILFSAWTDLTASGESVTSRAGVDPMIPNGDVLIEMASHYHDDPSNPLVSPLLADLTGLAPLLIQVGDAELLLDDSTRLAQRAEGAGVAATLQIWDEAPHVFQALGQLPESQDALDKVGAFHAALVR